MSAPARAPLEPGESRLTLTPQEATFAEHLVNVAAETPSRFGGLSDWGRETHTYRRLHRGTRLQMVRAARWGTVVLTREQREFLHLVLAAATDEPEMFGAFPRDIDVVAAIQRKLPPRGVGTYGD